MKFYDFIDKEPPIGKLAIVEGTQRVLAERALEVLIGRVLPAEVRELNLARFSAEDASDAARVAQALAAMPFLADRRVVVVGDAHLMRTPARNELWAVAQRVPHGSTLAIVDLLSPRGKGPQSFGVLAGRAALRIDTTAGEETRARFIRETLERLNVTADARVIAELALGEADLGAMRTDLEKLALSASTITLRDLAREALLVADPKAYEFARSVTEGKTAVALSILDESWSLDPRDTPVKFLSALATEWSYVWEMTRAGGQLPERFRWREPGIRSLARRLGRRRARRGFEHTVHGIEALVTGRTGSDHDERRALVERTTVELSALAARAAR